MDKIKLDEIILVEGRYDKAKLSSIFDAVIIPLHGFSIFTDHSLKQSLINFARSKKIILLTDSDSAGFKIRGYIKSILPVGSVIDVYIPDIPGKEKRKNSPSKEGKLGVEGIAPSVIKQAFEKAGVILAFGALQIEQPCEEFDKITMSDFIRWGLSGGEGSLKLREKVFTTLGLPAKLKSKAAINILNKMLSKQEFQQLVDSLKC